MAAPLYKLFLDILLKYTIRSYQHRFSINLELIFFFGLFYNLVVSLIIIIIVIVRKIILMLTRLAF